MAFNACLSVRSGSRARTYDILINSQAQLPTVLCRIIVWREELRVLPRLLLLGLTSSASSPLLHRQSEYLVA